MAGKLISKGSAEGSAIEHGGAIVTPISSFLIIRFPFGGYVLNRPTAIEIVSGNEEELVPIIDVTRIALLALMAVSVFFWIISWRVFRRSN